MLQFFVGVLLLPRFGGLVRGEVGADFSKCLKFFYQKTPPQGLTGYQPICQRYKNQYRFATLYDRQRRTPVYSAYTLRPADGKRPPNDWKYEPQLALPEATPEMQLFSVWVPYFKKVIQSQAVLRDYSKSRYTKGHLNPSMHQRTMEDREATFTLTNVVPQRKASNQGTWNPLESEILERFKSFCRGKMYVITGALPYESAEHKIRNRVSVPEYMWSAYCCPSYKRDLPPSVQPFFPTYAAVGRNDRNSEEAIVPVDPRADASVRGYDVRRMSLETLEGILGRRLAEPVRLFAGNCKKQNVKGLKHAM